MFASRVKQHSRDAGVYIPYTESSLFNISLKNIWRGFALSTLCFKCRRELYTDMLY